MLYIIKQLIMIVLFSAGSLWIAAFVVSWLTKPKKEKSRKKTILERALDAKHTLAHVQVRRDGRNYDMYDSSVHRVYKAQRMADLQRNLLYCEEPNRELYDELLKTIQDPPDIRYPWEMFSTVSRILDIQPTGHCAVDLLEQFVLTLRAVSAEEGKIVIPEGNVIEVAELSEVLYQKLNGILDQLLADEADRLDGLSKTNAELLSRMSDLIRSV